jgi:hypothetical protein
VTKEEQIREEIALRLLGVSSEAEDEEQAS